MRGLVGQIGLSDAESDSNLSSTQTSEGHSDRPLDFSPMHKPEDDSGMSGSERKVS